jgi:hypothetical protein
MNIWRRRQNIVESGVRRRVKSKMVSRSVDDELVKRRQRRVKRNMKGRDRCLCLGCHQYEMSLVLGRNFCKIEV